MGILFEKEVETNTGKKMDWDMFWNEIEKGEIWANILEWVSSHTRKEGGEKVDIRVQYRKLMYLFYEVGNKIMWGNDALGGNK